MADQMVGRSFGRLSVVALAEGRDNSRRLRYACECACGRRITVVGSSLRSGHTCSCGCIQHEWAATGNARAGTSAMAEPRAPRGSTEAGGPRDDCVEWQGPRNGNGYGEVVQDGRRVGAHRVAYEEARGPIPDGMFVCHSCDNPPCVNAEHLFLGTPRDNARDAAAKGRQHAQRGPSNAPKKLTEADVEVIRSRLQAGERQRVVAADFGVTQSTVSYIWRGGRWAGL